MRGNGKGKSRSLMSDTPQSLPTAAGPDNPLLKAWQTPFQTPPFGEIAPEHFLPAFEQAFADHAAEIAAITHDPSAPDFANTVTALERSGKLLTKVSAVFYDLVSAHSNPALLEIDKDVTLRMARHWNPIMMNAVLFGRIAQVYQNRASLGLTGEQSRLLERTYIRFHRAGAGLDEAAKTRMAEINEHLAQLGTTFSHNLLGDEQAWFLELGEDDLDGLPDSFVAAALPPKSVGSPARPWSPPRVRPSSRSSRVRVGATCAKRSTRRSRRAATTATPMTTTP
jgi:peptidyl-dipeptidase Dcp